MAKLPQVHIGKLTLMLAVLVWLALLFVDLVRIFGIINQLDSGISEEITWILEILFFFTLYAFYRYSIEKNTQSDFLNLIWRASSTGLIASGIGLLTELIYSSLGESKIASEPFLQNFFYHVNFAWTSIFLISTTLLWKHLILYQKNKKVLQKWQAFEFAMLVSMFFVFFNKNNFDYSFLFGLVILLIISIILSVNLKWIPYLTFKEKWKSLMFLTIILLSTGFLFNRLISYGNEELFQINLTDNLFLMALFGFIFIYGFFSFLVTLFNLPTSSVFEQKLTEAINFQKLSQSIQPGESEEVVLDILMESCISASYSDGAWLELNSEERTDTSSKLYFLDQPAKQEISDWIYSQKLFTAWESSKKSDQLIPVQVRLSHSKFESALIVPLVVNKSVIGKLILCKEVKDGFNKEMITIISTFTRQACIAVENHRLLNQALLNERYQEELKIAQRVQKALLPAKLDQHQSFSISAYSNTADEVGGDYYDTYKLDEHRFVLIIGDVSGKGTSAAFHMSQMKGVFHSLIQLGLSPSEFMIKANSALGKCLAKNHFITASIFLIDTQKQEICHARAGHVPTLFYSSKEQKSEFLLVDGLGLGILRNKLYENHVHEKMISYTKGDILVLITDGIVEGKNQNGLLFGYEQIRNLVEEAYLKTPKEIQQIVINSLHEFVGGDGMIDDDYSLMVVKFE
jgi:phosphoserine phosphatase RsbU/P